MLKDIYMEVLGKLVNTIVIIALLKIYLEIHRRWVLSLTPQYVKGVVCASEANKKRCQNKRILKEKSVPVGSLSLFL